MLLFLRVSPSCLLLTADIQENKTREIEEIIAYKCTSISFIQHKSLRIVCNLDVIVIGSQDTTISSKDPDLV